MKKYHTFCLILLFNFYYSQQTEGLRIIKNKYDLQLENIETEYKKNISEKPSSKETHRLIMKRDSDIRTLPIKRNDEYLEELPKIKVSESNYKFDVTSVKKFDEKGEVVAKPPKGAAAFKKEISNNFYGANINAKGSISCEITFVIERDGSIREVKAIGENERFNNQAILAIYLTEDKWEPARIDGYPVRYRFRIPLTMNF